MPSSTALSTPRTASRSTARPYANHQNPASAASLTPTTPSEPLKPSTGELSAIIGMLSAIDRNQCPQSIGTPVRNPRNPQPKSLIQLLGGPPSGAGSRQMYQLRFGFSWEERLSTNQGCRSDVWLGTKSSRILSPRA